METQRRIGPDEIDTAIQSIVDQIVVLEPEPSKLIVVGVANGGVPFGQILAKRLSERYGSEIPLGQVNITFHRDDLGQNSVLPEKFRTSLPVEPDGHIVILADDVIFSGRSVRAALAELFDLGRPDSVRLAILFDRGSRRLPIQPDVIGFQENVDASQRVKVLLDPTNASRNEISLSSK
ncbi:bifunctional pyr operon transcriptional regulator/uracil phosphoribosyltransferase PyrR [Cerasicoccus arenae]|nr:phosphoribosyltransferase family protein [Cerasicoccus arenae]MBK1857297.1 hypothetical protein [Cerasicoccus arenae]